MREIILFSCTFEIDRLTRGDFELNRLWYIILSLKHFVLECCSYVLLKIFRWFFCQRERENAKQYKEILLTFPFWGSSFYKNIDSLMYYVLISFGEHCPAAPTAPSLRLLIPSGSVIRHELVQACHGHTQSWDPL
jgi:hypothetical protein